MKYYLIKYYLIENIHSKKNIEIIFTYILEN